MIQICDKVEFSESKRKMTPEGYMLVPATLSRCGVYDYSAEACRLPGMEQANEIRKSLGLSDSDPLRVYRSPDEVFAQDSMDSFSMKPVTDNHPPEWINAKNAKYYAVGHAGESISKDGIFQKANLLITDEKAIKQVESGKVEISNGYECDIIKSVGVTDEGESYHAKFTNIRGNHIAIVNKGRAGSGCRISDHNQEGSNMKTKTIVHDGVSYEFSEQAAEIIGKLENKVAQVQDSLNVAKSEHTAALAGVQAELDAEKQRTKDAEAKIMDSKDIDSLIEARTALIADAKSLVADFDASGKSDAEIIEGVVMAVCDGVDLEGQTDEYKAIYCKARFDAALKGVDSKPDNSGNVNIKDGCDDPSEEEGEKARKEFIKNGGKK